MGRPVNAGMKPERIESTSRTNIGDSAERAKAEYESGNIHVRLTHSEIGRC